MWPTLLIRGSLQKRHDDLKALLHAQTFVPVHIKTRVDYSHDNKLPCIKVVMTV